jgi:hypothetical protein
MLVEPQVSSMKNEALRVEIELIVELGLAPLQDVRAILFGRAGGFSERDPVPVGRRSG